MPASSLLDMARRAMARYCNGITDIGDLPYELVRPALMKIDNPERLYRLEQQSPQIIGHDAEIWINFLKRDIPNWRNKPHEPADPKNWYKAYRKLKREAEKDFTRGEEALKAKLASLKSEREQNVAQVGLVVSKSQLPGIPGRRFQGKTNTKSMTLMEKIRKEARDARTAQAPTRPMAQLNKTATVVRQAPPRFVEEAKRKAISPPPRQTIIPTVRPPRPSRPPLHAPVRPKGPEVGADYDIMKDREARLRAMKSGRPLVQGNGTNSSAGDPKPAERGGPGKLSTGYLEDLFDDDDDEPEDCRTMLKPPPDRPRSASPGRMSPRPGLKRKAPAHSLFMSPKKPMLKRPGVT